jgi:hypothetical protein
MTQTKQDSSPEPHRFSETLQSVALRAEEGPVTLGELFVLCGPQGHAFLAIFLVLPFLQPLPLPGVSSAIGLALAAIGVFVALDRPPWLPARVARVAIDSETVSRICVALEALFGRLEKYVRPRGQTMFARRWFRIANGLVWVAHAVVFSLPLPIPFSNAFPATVVFLMALGVLEEDVALIALAYVGALANVAFFGALLVLPSLGWKALSH